MSSPDLIAPDRLEELLGGALPEAEQEARLQGLVRELRADAPAAPARLRARVRALAEAPERRPRALPRRRAALALAFVLAVAAVGAGVALQDDGGRAPSARVSALVKGANQFSTVPEALQPRHEAFVPFGAESELQADGVEPTSRRAYLSAGRPAIAPSERATDVSLWMEVRLPDADELSAAAAEAMAVTRELGGWVAGSDIDTNGNEGTAELALRVPVGRVEDAVVRLGTLGTVTGQRVATVDLQAGIDRRLNQIEAIERTIRMLELRLESGTLTPEQELETRIRLERRRNDVADLRRENRGDYREAATSELALVLHTREAAAAKKDDEGGAAGAAGEALDFLAAAGTIALFLTIVLSPVVLLVVLLWLAFRSRSRRLETRLLDRPDPASPPSA